VNPNLLILVEGIEKYDSLGYWWGGELSGAAAHPVTLSVPNQLVYSPHDYPASLYPQSWFSDPSYPANLPSVWDTHWGYLAKNNTAPILLGEFGTRLQDASDIQWFNALAEYIKANNLSFTFWCLPIPEIPAGC
jgi:endoglucanase